MAYVAVKNEEWYKIYIPDKFKNELKEKVLSNKIQNRHDLEEFLNSRNIEIELDMYEDQTYPMSDIECYDFPENFKPENTTKKYYALNLLNMNNEHNCRYFEVMDEGLKNDMIKKVQYYASGSIDDDNVWSKPEYIAEEDFTEISEEEFSVLKKLNLNTIEIGSYCFQEKEDFIEGE